MDDTSCMNCRNYKHSVRHEEQAAAASQISLCVLADEIQKIGDSKKWHHLTMPKLCGRYMPQMVEACVYCHQPINIEAYRWNIWAGLGSRPVCSPDCGSKLEAAEIAYFFSD